MASSTESATVYPDVEYFKVYPNPAYELVTIEIAMKLPARISIQMINEEGKVIRTLANDLFPVGRHFFETTLNSVPSGTYVIRYEKRDKVLTRKVVIK
ncbi:T9SS type A sorting domain-containing protein [Runella sp.]|uniref:T9SS type A sorting domain-containing protein n=1 Tax=Runella sp. TaxID=1960881 RepID=UPI003D103F61